MTKRLAAALLVSAAAHASGSVIYEQFNYSTGNLGTVGSPPWTATTAGTGDITVIANSLQYTDANAGYDSTVGTPAGNMVSIPNAAAKSDRIGTSSAGLPSGSGTLFYSLLLQVTNLTGVTTSGAFIAGFNNSAGTATTTITQAGARLQIRRDALDSTKFNLGTRTDVSATTGTSTIGWDAGQQTVGSTIFVVEEYQFNTVTNTDDVASIWINPDPLTLGAATPPAPNATSTGGDINQLQIQSFFLRALSGGGTTSLDEIRIDTSWAAVTTIPEPATVGLMSVGAFGLLRRRRRTG